MRNLKIIILISFLLVSHTYATSAFDIKWGTDLISNQRSNTLKQWAESIEGRVGAGSGAGNLGTGNIYYVDSGVTTEGDGTSWTDARDTIAEAVALCTANNGDVIYVAQGHAENIASAAALDLSTAGITIEGCGSGDDMPELSLTAQASTVQISAADVTVIGIRFLGNFTNGVAECIDVTADGDGAVIIGCEFRETANTKELLKMITVTADADRVVIAGNRFLGEAGGTDSIAISLEGGSDKSIIAGNTFIGDWSGYVIDGSTAASTEIVVSGNYIHNADTGAGKTMAFHSSTTGGIYGNECYGNGASFALVGDAMYVSPDNIATGQENVETATYFDMFGAFTGPAAGAAQDDNIKASLDLAHTDLDAILTDTGTTLPATLAGLSSIGKTGLCETNVTNTTVISSDLSGFGNDAFNEGWSLICTYDTGGAVGTAPSGEIRDITDYASSTGTFTTAAWTAALTAGDYVMLIPTHDVSASYGRIIYCDDGGSGGEGTNWQNAKTTLATAEAIASAGDIILVGENHNENVTTGGDLIDVAGVSVIGMGAGDSRPLFDMDADSDEITLDNSGITLKNLRFRPGATALTSCIRVEDAGIGCTIEDCAFVDGEAAGTDEWTDVISVDTLASKLTVRNCTYVSSGADCGTFVNIDEATIADCTIEGCYVYASMAEAGIWGAAAVPTNVNIKNNIICNGSAGQMAIEFQGAATGVISGNFLYTNDFATMIDPGSAYCFGNMGTDAIDQAAISVPISQDSSDIAEDDDGSDFERLEYLQNKVEDILAGIKMAGGSVGDVYYVDDGGSGGAATTWATAETTLDAAIADCTANVGDIIFVAPSHDEDLGAAQVTCDVAGITIIGIGDGAEQPQIVFNDATSSIDVTAAGVTIKNLNLHSTTAASTIGVDVDAGDFRIEDCIFTDAGDNEFTIAIDLGATAENAVIKNCKGLSTTGTTGATSFIAITGGVIDRLVVEGCHIIGDFDNAGIYSNQINTNALIKNNSVKNLEAGDHAMEFSAAMTGDLVDNMLYADTYGAVLDPGSMSCYGNKQCLGTDTGAEDVPLVAGRSYARKMLTGDLNASDDLFSVTGSPIIVTAFVGKATVACGGATTLKIFVDADDTFDYDCSTSVDVDTVDAGGTIAFTNAIGESVLTVQPVGSSGSMGGAVNWWVEEGMIESTVDAGGSTGDMEWYMIFTPVESGCEVVPQ